MSSGRSWRRLGGAGVSLCKRESRVGVAEVRRQDKSGGSACLYAVVFAAISLFLRTNCSAAPAAKSLRCFRFDGTIPLQRPA